MSQAIITHSIQVLQYCQELRTKKHRFCKIFYLDRSKQIISTQTHSLQYRKSLRVKDIFVPGFYLSASNIVMVHNHPSNKLFPSENEINLTKESFTAGCFLGIDLLDHIIMTKTKYYSFHEKQII